MANEIPAFDGGLPRNVAVLMIHDKIVADGEANSGKNAKVKASQMALEDLRGIAAYEFRTRYGCDCTSKRIREGEGAAENGARIAEVGTAI